MPNRIVNTPRSLSPSRGDSASAASFVSRKRSLVDSRQRTNCASERTPPESSGTRELRPRERVSVPAHWGAAPANPAGTRLNTGIMVTYHGTAHVRLPCALRPRGLANRNGEARIAGLCAVGRGFSRFPARCARSRRGWRGPGLRGARASAARLQTRRCGAAVGHWRRCSRASTDP